MSFDPWKWEADKIAAAVASMSKMMEAERAKAECLTAAADGARGFKPIKRYSAVGSFRMESWAPVERAREELEKSIAVDRAVKAENDEAAAHNARIVEAAVNFCKGIGLPTEERYAEGREREAKLRTARWLKGIHAVAPPVPRWQDVEYNFSNHVRNIEERARREHAEKMAREVAEQRERERLEAERERIAAELRREMQPSPQQALQDLLRAQVDAPVAVPTASLTLAEALEIE